MGGGRCSRGRRRLDRVFGFIYRLQEQYPRLNVRKLWVRWREFPAQVRKTYGKFEGFVAVCNDSRVESYAK